MCLVFMPSLSEPTHVPLLTLAFDKERKIIHADKTADTEEKDLKRKSVLASAPCSAEHGDVWGSFTSPGLVPSRPRGCAVGVYMCFTTEASDINRHTLAEALVSSR